MGARGSWGFDRDRSDCPDGGEAVLRAEGGAELSRRLLRYRPGKSAVDAVGRARERCWQYDWVVDLDIRAFFDTLDHDLVKRAVRKYTDCRWVLLYVERWLTAPIQREDGTLTARPAGTPQGGVVSPLLANIFLHLAFDTWMTIRSPDAVRAVRGRYSRALSDPGPRSGFGRRCRSGSRDASWRSIRARPRSYTARIRIDARAIRRRVSSS